MDRFDQVLELSVALAGVRERDEHLRRAATMLSGIFPGDGVLWSSLSPRRRTFESRTGPESRPDPELAGEMRIVARDHPVVASYRAEPADRRPRRNSDVASMRSWRATAAYTDVFARRGGTHQLSMVVSMRGTSITTAWTMQRHDSDFSDADVSTAAMALPTLSALWQANIGPTLAASDHALAVRERLGISTRETEVLELLVGGGSARMIGRVLRVSERTVHKHLQHLYAKLGVHDRLAAANEARSLGLVGRDAPLVSSWN